MRKVLLLVFSIIITLNCYSQSISVAPTRLYFDAKIGEMKTKKVRITNESQKKESFNVSFLFFGSNGNKGKTKLFGGDNDDDEHSATKYLSANPSFFVLEPGETKEIEVILQLANDPAANNAKWAAMSIKQTKERIAPSDSAKSNLGFGIVSAIQFVIHIFQTPPEIANNINLRNAEIISFKESPQNNDTIKNMDISVVNKGQTILDCVSYIEITNLQTGENERLKPVPFTLLPGGEREISIALPANLKKGKYSLLGVVDYRGKEVQAAEYELDIK
jgi:P pilus assembly chaperone PapD